MSASHYINARSVFQRFVLLLFIYSLLRLSFYVFNADLFPPISFAEWVVILLQGVRFDITAILYLNVLPFLMQLMPFTFRRNAIYTAVQKTLFIVLNIVGIVIALSDIAYYPFNAKRLDSEVLGLLGVLPTMAMSFIGDYFYLVIVFIVLAALLYFIYSKTEAKHSNDPFSILSNSVTFILLAGLIVLGLRGGIQHRPIRPVLAASYVSLDLVPLVTNSPFTFIYSTLNRKLDPKYYYSQDEVNSRFPIKHSLINDSVVTERPNIVYLILESFSGFLVGHLGADTSYTPYLDTLSEQSLVFTRSFSNGRRSSQGLVALTSGIPALMDDPFMYSPYLNNRVYGLPVLLKDLGYSTSFFNGSNKEMLGWQDYIQAVGFDRYYSRETYPYPEHYDGHWGIYDHHYLSYFNDELGKLKEPFLSMFFSLSSHDPFTVPDELKEQFKSGIGPYNDALLYSDWAVNEFFKKAGKEPWFDNTIFIITADHTINAADKSPEKDYNYGDSKINRYSLYYIPTLIYAPGRIIPKRSDKVIQQLDLFNASLELAGYEGPYYSFGTSVFNDTNGCAFQYVKGIYQLIQGEYIFLMKEDSPYALYNYEKDRSLKMNIIDDKPELVRELHDKMKSIVQQHNNTLIENNMRLD